MRLPQRRSPVTLQHSAGPAAKNDSDSDDSEDNSDRDEHDMDAEDDHDGVSRTHTHAHSHAQAEMDGDGMSCASRCVACHALLIGSAVEQSVPRSATFSPVADPHAMPRCTLSHWCVCSAKRRGMK